MLSILIPCHNDRCLSQVTTLASEAEALAGMEWEIIVADDASTDPAVIAHNRPIDALPHCRYILRPENVGRAAIRNFLAEEAKGDCLLFLDCDLAFPDSRFLARYREAAERAVVVYGGVTVPAPTPALRRNLRYAYERASLLSPAERSREPYKSFRTTNFLIRREAMLANPFDSSLRSYGYEDVLFGRQLEEHGVSICHIDNPAILLSFEPNSRYLDKVDAALQTLHALAPRLQGYSSLLTARAAFSRLPLLPAILSPLVAPIRRRLASGQRPSLRLLSAYKILQFSLIKTQ